ncbi:MAG TPA: GNAT family N-acetyltransferase [Treponema sp.]|nr:GNAT family N-acetyltransferase [Treponema sp.]
MTIDDYDEVYRLWSATPGMGLNDVDDSRGGTARYLARNPHTCFVAEQDGTIAGAIMSGHDGRRGMIHHTVVAESGQRKGIGTALVNAALAALRSEGISKVMLVVFARNEKGNAFWEKQGFSARTDLVYRNKALRELVRFDT